MDEKRFNARKKIIQNAKDNNLQARSQRGSPIDFVQPNKLIQDIVNGITHEEALKKLNSINDDINRIIKQKSLVPNQIMVLNTLYMVDEIFTGSKKEIKENESNEYDIFESKSKESAIEVFKNKFNIKKRK